MKFSVTDFVRRLASVIVVCGIFAAACEHDARAASPIKLNGPLVSGGDVSGAGLQFSPDGSRVLYLADQVTDGINEIFSVPSGGGLAVKLNGPLVAGGLVTSSGLAFSPDSSRVLYHADQNVDELLELFTVPSGGGTSDKMNDTLVAGGDVFSLGFQFSPDSSRVVYAADQTTDNVIEVYSVSSVGGTSVKLNGPIVANGDVALGGIQFGPNGVRVLYVADQTTDTVDELFSVLSNGGAAVKLNGALVTGGDVLANSVRFSPDSIRALYVADQATDDVFEVFSVSAAGGTAVKLNGALVSGGDVSASGLQFSPNSGRVLYLADQTTDEVSEIFTVPSAGGAAVKLNGPLVAGGDVSSIGLQFTANGSRVVYMADQTIDEVDEVFSVPSTGGTAVKLNGALAAGGDVHIHLVSPDSNRVLYHADQAADEVNEIFSVPVTGGTPVKLNGPLVAGGDVLSTLLQFSPDSSRVLYRADQTTDGMFDAFVVPSTGGTAVKVNAPLAAGGSVSDMMFSPDGSRILYLAGQNTDDVNEIFVRVVRSKFDAVGGSWDAGGNWDQGVTPDEVMQVSIDRATVVTATAGTAPRIVNELRLGGGSGTAVLELRTDAVISAINGFSILAGGVLRGDGVVDSGGSSVTSGGEIRVDAGERLRLISSTFINQGSVQVIGTSATFAEVEFSGPFTNAATVGLVATENATLRFNAGITNSGPMAISFGTSRVFGDVSNGATGRIVVSAGGQASFYDDVTNSGTLIVSASGGLASTAAFFGALTGNGVAGGGRVFIEGDLRPGFSPGTMTFGGDVSFGPLSALEIEIAGTTPIAQYDTIAVAGSASLSGLLDVDLLNGFTPVSGTSFTVMTYGARTGTFDDLDFPDLPAGHTWLLDYGPTSLVLSVTASLLPGDIDLDGDVDRADAAMFSQFFGRGADSTWTTGDFNADSQTSLADLALLQAHLGQVLLSPPAASPVVGVPEPSAGLMLTLSLSILALHGRSLRGR